VGETGLGLEGLSGVGLDSMCFIYHLEANPMYVGFTDALFRLIEEGELWASTSVLSLAEVLVRPMALGDRAAAADYRYWMENFPNLSLAQVDAETVVTAAGLRARYGLRLPDALQLASCLEVEADAFITNDKSLSRVGEPRVILISDLVSLGP
jgi:predicted nucleic acid-binding protein